MCYNKQRKFSGDNMKLSLDKIKEITLGAVRIEQDETGFNFYRFTKEQQELYAQRREDFYYKTFCSAGVQLRFKTNSRSLKIKVSFDLGYTRSYYAMDIFVDGKMVDCICNYKGVELPRDYTTVNLPSKTEEKIIELPSGEKEIKICLPWSKRTRIEEIALEDGAKVVAQRPKYKMLCFGDSITQGYDAQHPSNTYTYQLASFLDAQEFNKAIGGDTFFPELASSCEDFVPDFVTVAYGTNDWSRCTRQETEEYCRSFYQTLSQKYPNAKIFALTPIWRADLNEKREFGVFADVEKMIVEQTKDFNNVFVVSGFDFVPHDCDLYADERLHPNDEGFAHYYKNLSAKIKQFI